MTIITDKYNKLDAKLYTNHNLMAKKRRLYLFKRNISLEEKVDTAKGYETPPATATTTTTRTTTTSQQSQTSSSSSSSYSTTTTTPTFPSVLASNNTSCFRVPFDNESIQVLPQQQSHHHYHPMSEDCELLYPKALRICGLKSPPPLNSKTSNQPAALESHHPPSCSCINNCHRCCSRTCAGIAENPETFGRQQPWFPSMNSYYLLSETDDTNIGNGSNEAQKQHCMPNSKSSHTSASFYTSVTDHNSTPSNNNNNSNNYCRHCSYCINYLTTSTARTMATAAVATESAGPNTKLDYQFEHSSEILSSISSSSSSNNNDPTCYNESTHSGISRRRLRYLSQPLQTVYMILKMLLVALIPTMLPHQRCPPFETSSNNNNRVKIHKQQQQQPNYPHHYPQLEQKQTTHFHINDSTDIRSRQVQVQVQQQQKHKPQLQTPDQMSSLSRNPNRRRHQPMTRHLLPNVSYLNTLLMGLSFLSLCFVSSSQTLTDTTLENSLATFVSDTTRPASSSSDQVRLNRPETVCKSLDIRNSPGQMRQLANCTVIEGFLLINLINGRSFDDYNETYPLLTEVTDYIIVYQVYHLRSLGQIFPNLSVIRGRQLFEGYALIVYYNSHLEELGLPKLTTIKDGGIRIEKNVMLCFVKTIDWTQIVQKNTTDIYVDNNRDPVECPSCPGEQWTDVGLTANDLVCPQRQGRRHCWNSKTCQKFCPERCRYNCVDENTCCNESCLGGCSPDNVDECIICGKYAVNNTTCADKCQENSLVFLGRRCITAEECLRIGNIFENSKEQKLVPFNGNCSAHCPPGYYKEDTTCIPCDGKCIKKCDGALFDGAARVKEYHGCNYIDGSLTIIIKRASQISADLEYGLSAIETISGYLKVQGTYGLFDLRFFKNLKTIKGEQLFEKKYAFYVLENTDLESLWNPNQTVQIENGTVYFHFNPKLCLSEIHGLLPMLRNQTHFDKNEVAEDSNGSKGSCNTSLLDVVVFRLKSVLAIVNITNSIKYDDERTFIGYQFLHMEDPYGNATKYGFRPCDDGWQVSEPTKERRYIFANLKPFTRYAFYVKTMTISTERRNAQSPIQHFTTKSDQPSFVHKLQGYANSSSDIIMSWYPPKNPNGKLIKYKIRATYDDREQRLESRNYCKDPLKVSAIKIDKTAPSAVTEKPKEPLDCKCPKNPQGSVFNDEVVDANIHASIELENQLQNFIYVKKQPKANTSNETSNKSDDKRNRRALETEESFDSFMLRHIREAPVYPAIGGQIRDGTKSLEYNETRMDEEGLYYKDFPYSVNATTYDFTFTKLKHFSWYMLGIQACRELEENNNASDCSVEVKIYVRTLKLNDVDRVDKLWAVTETTNTSRTNVRLFWVQPERPNGAVVSYIILYQLQGQDEVQEKKCITEVDYLELDYQHNGYVLSGLQSGNYSIRILTNTLAGEGLKSDYIYVWIPPNTLAPSIIAGITVASIVLILLIGAAVYLLFRKRILAPPSDLKMFPSGNPHYISLQYIPDEWEVARERVIQLSSLGQGSFGMVYEGILKSNDDDTPCAIKTVNENATDRERTNFLNEACVMKQFDTYHVVRLLGVCSRGQPALVIMELMKNGDLKSYLRAHRPDERDDMGHIINRGLSSQPPPLSRIYQMAIEIADGMAYLAAKKFVHRDLAARNCMVAADLTVKIGDFGMTRDIYENDYYRKGTKGLLPVRWMPPESLRDGVYSTSSDVFSYGVVLWEMATLASQPYQGLANDQVLRYVIDGGVMERPENCPDKLYSLMQKCWHHRPTARPTFIEIIRYLFDLADPHFREVSFYNSEDGQHILNKEIADRNQRSGDVFDDPENDMEDVTTPLRLEEYSSYKLNMDNNSSMGQRGDSSMVMDDDAPHSPYSMGSPMVVSSTPDEQSRGSYNMSRILHPHSQLLNSAPSTSAGLRKLGSSSTSHQLTHPHTHPHHRNLYQPTRFSQQQARQHHSEHIDTYVQPDFGPTDEGNKRDSDEQGYEIYDPSPNYSEHIPSNVGGDDDEDDFGAHSTAGQNLLLRPKGRQKQPTIMPLSTSMPDDVIGQQAASSLHPSTASAASSNASSKAGTGKYPSLRAVADSARLRMMNMRIFNHKRSGSNASHKSTSSNPNSSAGVGGSINNLARSGRGKSMSGQNLGTIESGGSGSAGSYCANQHFFSPSSGTSTSDNPNYRRLDNSLGDNSIIGIETSRIRPRLQSASAFMMGSSQPNYKMLDESLNTTGASVHTGENPNYEIMQPGGAAQSLTNEAASTYVMMNEPAQKKMPEISAMDINDANYQMMCPLLQTNTIQTTATVTTPATVLAPPPPKAPAATTTTQPPPPIRPADSERGNTFSSTSSTTPPSTSSSHESEEDDDLNATKDIKLNRMSSSRRSSSNNDHLSRKASSTNDRSRSQSSSSGKSATNTASSSTIPTPGTITSQQETTTGTTTTGTETVPSSTFSRKEKWFKEQQQPPQPPPNGFVGREA